MDIKLGPLRNQIENINSKINDIVQIEDQNTKDNKQISNNNNSNESKENKIVNSVKESANIINTKSIFAHN